MRRFHPGEGYNVDQLREWAEQTVEDTSWYAKEHQAAIGVLVLLDQTERLLGTAAQVVNADPASLQAGKLKAELGLLVTAFDPTGDLLAARSLRSVT